MYKVIKGGSFQVIYNDYTCWLPPVPPDHEILFNTLPKADQYWRREPVPEAFTDLFREESAIREEEKKLVDSGQKKKVTYVNPVLEKYRRREFFRRRWGTWFYNNGMPTYLTGHHYFYLQWYLSDNGYPNYYEFSRKTFYFRQHSEEDPFALGYMVIGPRGTGKSQEELACILNNMTMRHHATAVLQSKNFDKDAKGVLFQTKARLAFNNLPAFFKPVNSHGSQPQNGFDFTRDAVKGEGAKHVQYGDEFELDSFIFPVLPGDDALDGDTIAEIFEDEIGKTDPTVADVTERHKVNVKAVWRNHTKIGLMRKTSTVEKMTNGGTQCHALWKESDPKKRDGNHQTVSKLNRMFISALDTDTTAKDIRLPDGQIIPASCDRYGFVDRQIANRKIQAALDLIKHDYVAMSSEMRKNPRHEGEAFIPDQSQSIFNIQKLTDRLNYLRNTLTKPLYTRGNLYWLKEKFGPVGFAPDAHAGRFNWAWFPDEFLDKSRPPDQWKVLNNFGEEWGYDPRGQSRMLKFPRNDHLFRLATDPIKYSKTKDPRASKCAIHGFRLMDVNLDYGLPKEKWKSHNFIFEYCERPEDPETCLEDMAMVCLFLGARMLPERNIPAANEYFEQNGLHRFLTYPRDMIMSTMGDIQINSDDAGYASTPEVIDAYTRRLIKFINEHIDRMVFDNTIEDWMGFDSTNPTKSHMTVSSGFDLIHAERVGEKPETESEDRANNWFDTADNSGVTGRWRTEEEEEEEQMQRTRMSA